MDDEYPQFEALNEQCNAYSTHQLLAAMQGAVCTVPAASCAEYDALAPLEESGIVGLLSADHIEFSTQCMLASDFGTTGHPFTRFWHYTGGDGAVFPPVSDVLADQYGMCTDEDACFGRLPEWLDETGAELIITDGATTIQFTFDPSNNIAHAAWQAFHDHATSEQLNGDNWTPTLLAGEYNTIQPDDTDSFFYGDAWGVSSFLLDDDGCYCNSALEAGKIVCRSDSSFGDTGQGATLSAGVDFVAPEEGCEYVSPTKGPLSMYFREREPPTHTSCATIKAQHPRAESGIYTVTLVDTTSCSVDSCDACVSQADCVAAVSDSNSCSWSTETNICGLATHWDSAGTFSYTVPANVNTIYAKVWGAGGGGGAGNGAWATGGGGGGFSTVQVAVQPGEIIDVTVGEAGMGALKDGSTCGTSEAGYAGGSSSFGSYASASGGEPGCAANCAYAGGAGGSGTSEAGQAAPSGTQNGVGGNAGGLSYGGGAGGDSVPNYTEGLAGSAPGGGGSGGPSCQNGHAGGGNGADGAVEIFATFIGRAVFDVYCDMETDGGGWTLVMNQNAGECLADSTLTLGAFNGNTADNYRLGSSQMAKIQPSVAWVLTDATNRVYFRPGCVVDYDNGHLRDQNYQECEHGFTDATFETPTSSAVDSNGSEGIGMNNNGNFCSIRAFIDVPLGSINRGCAVPCDSDWASIPEQPVQLWFK